MPTPLRLVLAALAGAVVAASFEPVGWVYLLPLGVAGLALLLRGLSARSGFLVGTVFGTAFMLLLLPWLQVIGVDAWILLSMVQGLFYGLLGSACTLVQRLPWWPVWTAMLWVGAEALRSSVPFGGFPWGRLAFATVDTPAAPLMGYAGAAGTGFVVALLGAALAWAVLHLRRAPVLGASGVLVPVLLVVGSGVVAPWGPAEAARPDRVVSVAAVQGDVPGVGMDAFAERRAVLENHVEATHALADRIEAGTPAPDLVVWPENSTDIDPFSDPDVHEDISAAVDAVGVPVLVGAMVGGDADPTEVYNQGIVWLPGAGPQDSYSKTHPVPFGEYIPMRDLVAPFFERLDQIPRDMVAGTEPGVLEMGGTTIGDVICFEIAYDDVVHDVVRGGAELLVVQTNNATYMGTGQVEQQFAIARLRAIETNRHVVVAATNGVSGMIAPDGRVVTRAPVRTQEVLRASLPIRAGTTPALQWGLAVELALAGGGVAAVVAALVLRRRRRGGTNDASGETSADRPPRVPAGAGEA